MSHNDPTEKVLHSEDERQLRNLAKRAINPKQHLSFFERQQAHDLGLDKTLDSHGNIDLNEAANEMHQPSGIQRTNPNVKASESYSPGVAAALDIDKAAKQAMDKKAKCHQHCRKNTGRSQCTYCFGQGTDAGDRMNSAGHQSRNQIAG